MPLSDVYVLTLNQNYGGKVCQNVFMFEKLAAPGTAEDLIAGFITGYLPAIRQLQAQGIQTDGVEAYNLGDLGDFGKTPLALPGLAGAGDTLPSFNAVGYTLNPATRAVRPGSKRFTGLLEAVVTNGVITEPTYVANVEAMRIKLDDNIVGAEASYQPVIVKRIKTLVAGTVPPKYKYALPKPGDTLVLGLVKSATSSLNVTSQVSRKKG